MSDVLVDVESIVKQVERILSPLGELDIMNDKNGNLSVFKDGIKFGMILDQNIYLVDRNKKFKKYDIDIFSNNLSNEDIDGLIKVATTSYWIAADKLETAK